MLNLPHTLFCKLRLFEHMMVNIWRFSHTSMNFLIKLNPKCKIVKKFSIIFKILCQRSSILKPFSGTWFLGSSSFWDSDLSQSMSSGGDIMFIGPMCSEKCLGVPQAQSLDIYGNQATGFILLGRFIVKIERQERRTHKKIEIFWYLNNKYISPFCTLVAFEKSCLSR